MGLGIGKMSSCRCGHSSPSYAGFRTADEIAAAVTERQKVERKKMLKNAPKPDYTKHEILDVVEVMGWTLVKIKYDEETNYEGTKIILYACRAAELVKAPKTAFDPHFCEGNHLSPFARFEPTDKGWNAAIEFMNQNPRA